MHTCTDVCALTLYLHQNGDVVMNVFKLVLTLVISVSLLSTVACGDKDDTAEEEEAVAE
tara:strand:+ start:208 stop:384 length:177 start_codon:yes stop_codon:yes gene_type:complete